MVAIFLATKHPALGWLIHLGGPGLILLGLADNSVIPLPGSMDVLTIVLAASRPNLWFVYAIWATTGAVIGGYVTYHLAHKGGKESLERKFSKAKVEKVYKKFERWGVAAVAIPALLPPPFPIVPALVVAGAMQYPRRKFVAALAFGRAIRFTVLAALGAHYGRHIIGFFSQYYKPALGVVIAIGVVAGIAALLKYRQMKKGQRGSRQPGKAPRPRREPKVRVA